MMAENMYYNQAVWTFRSILVIIFKHTNKYCMYFVLPCCLPQVTCCAVFFCFLFFFFFFSDLEQSAVQLFKELSNPASDLSRASWRNRIVVLTLMTAPPAVAEPPVGHQEDCAAAAAGGVGGGGGGGRETGTGRGR